MSKMRKSVTWSIRRPWNPGDTRITCYHLRQSPVKTESIVPVYELRVCINSRRARTSGACVWCYSRMLDDSKLVTRPSHTNCIHTCVPCIVHACWSRCVRVSLKIVMEREGDDQLMRRWRIIAPIRGVIAAEDYASASRECPRFEERIIWEHSNKKIAFS